MRLLKLTLENFQGIKSLDFEIFGRSASIFGDNETGKTTVYNSVTWLLFGKASTGAKNYTPQTIGPDGPLHNLNHSVEGQFQLEDGRIITLKKDFHEVWKKVKGKAAEKNTGCTIDYYINGVPEKEKVYTDTVTGYCGDAEKMKMLTIPSYFSEDIKMEDRRKILLEVCGDITDKEIIEKTQDLAKLKEFLIIPGTKDQQYDVDDYKQIAKAQENKINDELKTIPARIDEAQKAIADVAGLDKIQIGAQLKDLEEQKGKLQEAKAQAMAGNTAEQAVRKKKAEINTRLAEARTDYARKISKANEGTYKEIDSLKQHLIAAKDKFQNALSEADRISKNAERLGKKREELIAQYKDIQGTQWDNGKEVCPTCHRPLPEEDIQKLREGFNLNKSKKLEDINEQGQMVSKDKIAECKMQKEKQAQAAEAAKREISSISQQIEALQAQIQQPEPFDKTDKYKNLMAELSKVETQENSIDDTIMNQLNGYTEKIAKLDAAIHELESKQAKFEAAETQRSRIVELEADEKNYSKQYEKLEQGIYLCDLFIRIKAQKLTNKINSKFRSVRFRLFQEQFNGGTKEDCEVMVPKDGLLIPYAYANNAARINAGLEIIETLSDYWDLTLPVFIDNAESVTKLNSIDTQVIRLVVSETDKYLRLKLEAAKEKENEVVA